MQFFFKKRSNNLFFVKITNNICPRRCVFKFCNHKNFFRPIWSVTFCKNVSIWPYSNNIINFKFRIFIINPFTKSNLCNWFYINRVDFNFLWYVLLYIFPLSSNLLIYSFFDIEVIYLWISFFMVLINFLGTTNFPSLCIDYISIAKLTAFICPCFVWVAIWFFSIFLKSISNCNTYFIFQTNNACVFTGNIKKNSFSY